MPGAWTKQVQSPFETLIREWKIFTIKLFLMRPWILRPYLLLKDINPDNASKSRYRER